MNIPRQAKHFGERFGLAPDAIFRLWKSALKDDESLIDEAIAATYAAHSRTERSARAADARAPKPDFAPAKSGGGVLAAKACLAYLRRHDRKRADRNDLAATIVPAASGQSPFGSVVFAGRL